MISSVMILYPLVASNEQKKRKGKIKIVKKSKDAICIDLTAFPLLFAKTVCAVHC